MKQTGGISAYWMGWVVAGAVSALCCILLAARMFAYETLCRPEELCLREWVSALSSLIGAVVAFSSLAYVAKQIEQASRHHRDAMRVQLQRTRSVARRARKTARSIIDLGSNFLAPTMPSNRVGGWDFNGQIKSLSEALSDPVFRAFEQEVDLMETGAVAELYEALKQMSDAQYKGFAFGPRPFEQDVRQARFLVAGAVRYAEEIVNRADVFLRESDELLGS